MKVIKGLGTWSVAYCLLAIPTYAMTTGGVAAKAANKRADTLAHRQQEPVAVEMFPQFTDRLMPERGGGVTGGDGSISIDLQDGRSLFMWGDSFLGDVIDGERPRETSKLVIGNIFTVLSRDTVLSYFRGTASDPESWLVPDTTNGIGNWYWPGNGFVRDKRLHLFMSEFRRTGNQIFDFGYVGCDYFILDAETLEPLAKYSFPAANANGVHYGHAVVDDGDYVYNYGTLTDATGFASVHVARAALTNGVLQDWQYYSDGSWIDDPTASTPLQGIQTNVSEQFNVFKLKGRYVLVTQTRSQENEVFAAISDSPAGPFIHEKKIFKVSDPLAEKKMFAYNTMVHPQFQKDGRILMCYNVNCFEEDDLFNHASYYKPRFFWVPVKAILGD